MVDKTVMQDDMMDEFASMGVDTEATAPNFCNIAIEKGSEVQYEITGYNIKRMIWTPKKGDRAGLETKELRVNFFCKVSEGQELCDINHVEFGGDNRQPKNMFVEYGLNKDRAGYLNEFYKANGMDMSQLEGYEYFADLPKTTEVFGTERGVIQGVTDPLFDSMIGSKFVCIVNVVPCYKADEKVANGEIEEYEKWENTVKKLIIPE